jgi:hypothetical protein
MKKITNKTILKQGDKTFVPIESDGVIYWRDEHLNFVAQTEPKLKDVPVISLATYIIIKCNDAYHEHDNIESANSYLTGFQNGYQANPNHYTLKDIERAIELAQAEFDEDGYSIMGHTKENVLKQINSIQVIEVDEQFNILSYE